MSAWSKPRENDGAVGGDALDAALEYSARGWAPLPIQVRSKKPTSNEWQACRFITEEQIHAAFKGPHNIGVILGAASGGLADVDLDTPEAVVCAPFLLPPTDAIFGRASKRASHYLYRAPGLDLLVGKAAEQFREGRQVTLVELRVGGDDKGAQTVFPPSVHESGEQISWDGDGEPGDVDPAMLRGAVRRLAAAALVARHWPDPHSHSRHEAALRLGGLLAGCGLGAEDCERFVEAVAAAAGDDEPGDRVRAALDAAERKSNGGRGYGFPAFAELFGEPVAKKVAEWLGGAPEARAGSLMHWPQTDRHGQPIRTYQNTRHAIEKLGFSFDHDVFHERRHVCGQALGRWAGEVSDEACGAIRQLICDAYEFDPGKEHVHDAVATLCDESAFNPVVNYLVGLTWDGNKRIDTWLTTYLGALNTPLNRAIGRLMLIAAVRRASQPGCKFDNVIVFEGIQGAGKSSAMEIMAGKDAFSDQELLTLDARAQQEVLQGVWIFELGELHGLSKADVRKVKAFVSRTHDRARPAYGRSRVDRARHCIFVGTTNQAEYLRDTTGNRRFWPVRTGAIDLAALRHDRDQLWAEAADLEADGALLELSPGLWSDAAREQEERREHDPWIDVLQEWLELQVAAWEWDQVHKPKASEFPIGGAVNGNFGEYRVRSSDCLASGLLIPSGQQTPAQCQRLADCMGRLGWGEPRQMRVKGVSAKGYARPRPKLASAPDRRPAGSL